MSFFFFFFLKHWIEVKSIDRDPRWYTRRVKEAISQHFTLTKSTGTVEWKFLKRGCPRPKKTTTGELHDNEPSREQLTSIEGRNVSITAVEKPTNHSGASSFIRRPETSRPYSLIRLAVFSRNVAIHIISNTS